MAADPLVAPEPRQPAPGASRALRRIYQGTLRAMPLQHRRDRAHSPRVVMAPPLRRAISPLMSPRTQPRTHNGGDGGTTKQHHGHATTSIFDSRPPRRVALPREHPREFAHTETHGRRSLTLSLFSFLFCLSALPVAPSPHRERNATTRPPTGGGLTATISCAASSTSSRGCRRHRMPRQEPAVLCHMFRDGHLSRSNPHRCETVPLVLVAFSQERREIVLALDP